MKKLIAVSALAAAFAAFAENTVAAPALDFESVPANSTPVVEETGGTFWNFVGTGDDGSLVQAYEGSEVAAPAITGPIDYTGDNTKFLALSTEGGILWRGFGAWTGSGEGATATAQTVPATGLFVDTLVQFTPTEDGGTPEAVDGEKLAIWLNVSTPEGAAAPVTNLMVKAGSVSSDGTLTADGVYTLTGKTIDAGKWYRLTVKAIDNVLSNEDFYKYSGFVVMIDGEALSTTTAAFDETFVAGLAGTGWIANEMLTDINAKKVLPSMAVATPGTPSTLTSVGFKGSGAIDDLVLTTEDPFAVASVDFTLTWTGVTPVSYTINGGAPISLSDATGTSFLIEGVPAGASITFIYQNGDGVEKRTTGTIAANGSLAADEAYTWNEYLGAPVNGAYTIDDGSDFELFQKGVNNAEIPTAGVTFKMTADIALSEATDGIGARDMKDTLGSDLAAYTAANTFNGTFDGDNHTISGVILKTGDYIGFFNSCYGATIKNLKLSLGNATGWSDATADQVGAVFVGVSVNTTLENCQTLVAGDNGSFNTFKATKTAAGFVGFAANGTVISNCVNNLNVESVANEKAGGFVACAQAGKSTGDGIVIDGCSNLGDVKNGNTNPFLGGFVGYADLKVTFKGANTVAGTITPKSGNYAKSLLHVNSGSVVVAEGASFTVPAGYKTVTDGKAVDGLFFATVDGNNVATLVKNADVALDGSYKVMASGAAYQFTEAGSITFDNSLVTTFAPTAAEGLELSNEGYVWTAAAPAPAYPTYIGDEDTEKKDWYDTWKEAYTSDDDSSKEEQFLLNIAPAADAAAIAAAKAAFTITSITPDGNGGWTVKVTGEKGDGDRYGNGRIEIQGATTLNGPWAKNTNGAKFFKAVLK